MIEKSKKGNNFLKIWKRKFPPFPDALVTWLRNDFRVSLTWIFSTCGWCNIFFVSLSQIGFHPNLHHRLSDRGKVDHSNWKLGVEAGKRKKIWNFTQVFTFLLEQILKMADENPDMVRLFCFFPFPWNFKSPGDVTWTINNQSMF